MYRVRIIETWVRWGISLFALQIEWTNEANKNEYLARFQEDFYNVVKRQIDYHMVKVRPKDILYDEILEHSIQCRMLDERFCARDDILEKVKCSSFLRHRFHKFNRSNFLFYRTHHANHVRYMASQAQENHQLWLK
jgi:hypothetical protein